MTIDWQAAEKQAQAEIDKILSWTIEARHRIHKNPELTWQEENTAAFVMESLSNIEDLVIHPITKTGVVCVLEGAEPGPTLALRGDMDALPIQEMNNNIPYKSCHDGVMHACGHDGHTANLMGSVRVLSNLRKYIKGKIKFIFQPAEEGGAGALAMCKEGVLQNPKVDAIFGLHAWPESNLGEVLLADGPMMAGNATIDITLKGRGGHAALPHLATDQILGAARLVQSLMNIRARLVAPSEPFCLTITRINGGSAYNIIPDEVTIAGTMRALSRDIISMATKEVERLSEDLAKELGGEVEVRIKPLYPPVVNNKKAHDFLQKQAQTVIGPDRVKALKQPTMGAEDFSYYLDHVPGAFFFLGMKENESQSYPSLHHPKFNFNDRAFATSLKVYTQLGLRFGHSWSKVV